MVVQTVLGSPCGWNVFLLAQPCLDRFALMCCWCTQVKWSCWRRSCKIGDLVGNVLHCVVGNGVWFVGGSAGAGFIQGIALVV